MKGVCTFTVFTATYNRAHTLSRVYDSLCAQTRQDFEWLIIDDGSSDGTADLVAGWAAVANFTIRYLRQENSGKHIAYNRALLEARGRFFLPLDSDDAFTPNVMEKIEQHWSDIPEGGRATFAGIGGLCCDQFGQVVGDYYPTQPFDADMRELNYIYKIRGEKWVAVLTDIARLYPFAEISGTQFIPEGVVWHEIAKHYKIRWFNEVYRIYYVNDEVTGTTLSLRPNLSTNAPGFLHYYIWLLNSDLHYFFRDPLRFLKAAAVLPVVARISGMGLNELFRALNCGAAKLLVIFALPLSALVFLLDATRRHRPNKVRS